MEGRIQHFRGTAGGVDTVAAWTYDGGIVQLGIGASVANAGDINGDGRTDLIAGSSPSEAVEDVPGAVYVFLAGPLAPLAVPPDTRARGDRLAPPAPSPFSSRTSIEFTLESPGEARLSVHDLAGRRVRMLADGAARGGTSRATWDGRDERGLPCRAGVYVARRATARGSATRRVVFLP